MILTIQARTQTPSTQDLPTCWEVFGIVQTVQMVQTVSGPTRGNNLLDILAQNEEGFVNNVRFDDAGCVRSFNGAGTTGTRLEAP